MLKHFLWQAINAQGFKTHGACIAHDALEVKRKLIQDNLTPLKIKRQIKIQLFHSQQKITYEQISEFFHELAMLITSGIPLLHALSMLKKNITNKTFRLILAAIEKNIAGGQLLSETLQAYSQYFDATTCNLIYAGEQSGTLDVVLQHISRYREKITTLQRNIKKALFYPLIVLSMACLVAIAILIFVIPQFSQLFASTGMELPVFTKHIMQLAGLLKAHGLLSLVLLAAMIISIKTLYRKSITLRKTIDSWVLRCPILGKVISQAEFARCFNTLALMLHSGLPLDTALQLTAAIAGNSVYQNSFKNVAQQIATGQSLHAAITAERYFTDRIIQMISIGEESGCLDEMLRKLSEYYTAKLDYFVQHLNQLLEPILMIFLCLVVGSLVIAVYLPIFQLGAAI